jgi:UDP-3-O-[3-hydroxymyristoyl] N-acetylglucosamine deacetylase
MRNQLVQPVPRMTLASEVTFTGPGAMTGASIELHLLPASDGISFVRSDTSCRVQLAQGAAAAGPSWTVVGSGPCEVRLVEHLLAAFAGLGITDAAVVVSGPEIPLLDGSAQAWVELIQSAGQRPIGNDIMPLVVCHPIVVADHARGQTLAAFPYPHWRLVHILDWRHPQVPLQTAHFEVGTDDFPKELAPARTFALAADARSARDSGLFPAATEENLIVIFDDYLSAAPPFPNAFARHKVLDLLGDLYTAGRPLAGLFVGYNSGHALNHRLLHTLTSSSPNSWLAHPNL